MEGTSLSPSSVRKKDQKWPPDHNLGSASVYAETSGGRHRLGLGKNTDLHLGIESDTESPLILVLQFGEVSEAECPCRAVKRAGKCH